MTTADEKKAAEADAAKKEADAEQAKADAEKDALGQPKSENPADNATTGTSGVSGEPAAHQDGAPPELAKAADEAAERGKIGGEAKEFDYSQANPDVMGR